MLNIEIRRTAAAIIGALILSTASIGAAVGPATATPVTAPAAI
jgi:hypothetical protein